MWRPSWECPPDTTRGCSCNAHAIRLHSDGSNARAHCSIGTQAVYKCMLAINQCSRHSYRSRCTAPRNSVRTSFASPGTRKDLLRHGYRQQNNEFAEKEPPPFAPKKRQKLRGVNRAEAHDGVGAVLFAHLSILMVVMFMIGITTWKESVSCCFEPVPSGLVRYDPLQMHPGYVPAWCRNYR